MLLSLSSRSRVLLICFIMMMIMSVSGCFSVSDPQSALKQVMPPEETEVPSDPVTGTWNGFKVTSSVQGLVIDPATADEAARIRLNIYPDRTFEYTSNFTIRNGTLIATGKGNYVVMANDTQTDRKYFRYDEDLDILTWESQDISIEFRRNDRVSTRNDLENYNAGLLEEYTASYPAVQAGSPTPVPTRAIAQIWSEGFEYDPTQRTIYQMNGVVRTEYGIYDSVRIIIRYPDNDMYQLDVGGMGGSNYTKKDFKMILNSRVENQTPGFFIGLDSTEYPAVLSGTDEGITIYTAYTNISGSE